VHHAAIADATTVVEEDAEDPRGEVVDLHEPRDSRPLRQKLAQDAAEGYEEIRGALQAAINATKGHPAACPKCSHRFRVSIPDHGAAIKAAQLWIDQGYGRPERDEGAGTALGLEQLVAAIDAYARRHGWEKMTAGLGSNASLQALKLTYEYLRLIDLADGDIPPDGLIASVRQYENRKRVFGLLCESGLERDEIRDVTRVLAGSWLVDEFENESGLTPAA
jgi:hypothetical protein